MDQEKDQKWQDNTHSTFVFAKIRSFFQISRTFAEEKTAFAESPPFRAGCGLIIGYLFDAYAKTYLRYEEDCMDAGYDSARRHGLRAG